MPPRPVATMLESSLAGVEDAAFHHLLPARGWGLAFLMTTGSPSVSACGLSRSRQARSKSSKSKSPAL
eukprot:5717386-Alexandrium_andersonii.AAC.1